MQSYNDTNINNVTLNEQNRQNYNSQLPADANKYNVY